MSNEGNIKTTKITTGVYNHVTTEGIEYKIERQYDYNEWLATGNGEVVRAKTKTNIIKGLNGDFRKLTSREGV